MCSKGLQIGQTHPLSRNRPRRGCSGAPRPHLPSSPASPRPPARAWRGTRRTRPPEAPCRRGCRYRSSRAAIFANESAAGAIDQVTVVRTTHRMVASTHRPQESAGPDGPRRRGEEEDDGPRRGHLANRHRSLWEARCLLVYLSMSQPAAARLSMCSKCQRARRHRRCGCGRPAC